MKPEQQIKALAELDGYAINGPSDDPTMPEDWCFDGKGNNCWFDDLEYLTSYDAIIPLVRKQSWHIHQKIWIDLCFMLKSQHIFIATPAQLCEALLKATGRWTE